jgi:hypothetical protein
MQVTRTQAIINLLKARTHPDLANLYNFNMEVQVNVAQDNGERVAGEYKGKRWNGWTDGIQTWKSFRIPRNASTEPEYTDVPMNFDLAVHAEGIGMTGWDWVNKCSRWVAYDFDSIVGHSTGLTHVQLREIETAATSVPWVTLRRSTSGNGLHIYVMIQNPVVTVNHNEHAALARSILGQLAAVTGFDFSSAVDICGGNMWVWHRKMTGTPGLSLVKQGHFLSDIPPNWREHVKVISGHRRKNLPQSIEDQASEREGLTDVFAELTGQYTRQKLDEEHKRLINWLRDNGALWWWDQDNNMLVTHTFHLKEAHEQLQLRGIFNTIAEGKEKGSDHNCFCFPLRKGAWAVRRFTPGVREHESWEQDGAGWTRCFYNMDPRLSTAARSNDGNEHPSGGYVFRLAENAQAAALTLGVNLNLPNWALSRPTKIKEHKDGRLIVEIDSEQHDDPRVMKEWVEEKGTWKRVFNVKIDKPQDHETKNFDDMIRHIVSDQGTDAGWVVRTDGNWIDEPLTHVRAVLSSVGLKTPEIATVIGDNVLRNWRLVNRPFEPEYIGDRQWNRGACQLMYNPSLTEDLHHPTWNRILEHVGHNLNEAVKANKWAQNAGLVCGADYLKCWIASVFQCPGEPLPYLFLFGPEASGKSIFHEALSLLISQSGYKRAESALTNATGFNGELANAVICVVEEINLTAHANKTALQRIKDWVTSPYILIHHKNVTPCMSRNTTHWIQCANDAGFCPVFPGDTRITMVYVEPVPKEQWLNKRDIFNSLTKEAPDFLGEVMRLELPTPVDRLNIPILETADKYIRQQQNRNALMQFIDENCHIVPGSKVLFAEFYERFIEWLGQGEATHWSKHQISKNLIPPVVKGRDTSDKHFIGNISFQPAPDGWASTAFTVVNGYLILKTE